MEYPFKSLMPLDEATARTGYYRDWTHIDADTFHQISELVKFIREKGYGSDTREAIAQALERVYYDAMKSGNADMELSVARKHFRDLAARLDAGDTDMRNISVDWINKNLGKLDQSFMTEEFLQQMAGTTPISSIPANGSVTTGKIADKAVTESKVSFFENTRNEFNKEQAVFSQALTVSTGALSAMAGIYTFKKPMVAGQTYTIKDGIFSGSYGHGFFNASDDYISGVLSSTTGPQTITAPVGTSYAIISGVVARIDQQQIELGAVSTPYIAHKVLNENYLKNKASIKNNRYSYIVSTGGTINVDTKLKEIKIPAGYKYIFYGEDYVTLPSQSMTFNYTNGFLYYDPVAQTFGSGDIGAIRYRDDVLMLGYLSGTDIFINANYTLDGASGASGDFQSSLKNKRGVTFGDSITWYDGQPFGASHTEAGKIAIGYQSYMREILGCVVVNKGASGQDVLAIANIIKSYASYADTDFITITSGANDERKGVPVGAIGSIGSDFDLTTFTGALQSSIEHVINANKKIKIFLMTPIRGWYNEFGTVNVPNTDPSVVGMMSEKYADAIKAVGKLYGLPVLDWYNDTRLNELNKNDFMGDGLSIPYYLHPTNEFYERMASPLIPFLNNN